MSKTCTGTTIDKFRGVRYLLPPIQATIIPTIKPTAIPTVTTFKRGMNTVPFISQAVPSETWLDNELPSSRAQEFNLNTQAKPSLQPDHQRILL
jgi:hypothetical protein